MVPLPAQPSASIVIFILFVSGWDLQKGEVNAQVLNGKPTCETPPLPETHMPVLGQSRDATCGQHFWAIHSMKCDQRHRAFRMGMLGWGNGFTSLAAMC